MGESRLGPGGWERHDSVEPSDSALIDAVRRGDRQSFETLYRRYRDWVAALAFEFCGHREDALDVLQETFLYLHRRLPTFELRCRFKSFLYPVVKHLALERKRLSRRPLPEPRLPAAEPGTIEHLLAALPEGHREVVRLRFVDDLDLQEIADALDVPLGTVKSRLHTALDVLRRNPVVE